MSKADKSATRSALKANLFRGPRLKVVHPLSGSWWIAGAAADARATFIALAHARDLECGWGSKTPDHPARAKA